MTRSSSPWLGRLAAVLTLAATSGSAGAVPSSPFTHQQVLSAAQALAAAPFEAPPALPRVLTGLDYDTYRQVRFRKEAALWQDGPTPFRIEGFAPGAFFKHGVEIFTVEDGVVHPVVVDADTFEAPNDEVRSALITAKAFSGFRLHYPLNVPHYADEFLVFQGVSYFRGVSRGQSYGLSARGLAVDVADPKGEEFPLFRRFWIERPMDPDEKTVVVHALMDSARLTGAYRFEVRPGAPTSVVVSATIFARRTLTHLGLGALTSMFMFGPNDGPDLPDYRPAVHDSLGLAIERGNGENVWRPLTNPKSLQISIFSDENPRGFGLIQRERGFEAFQDTEAQYHRRPSAWVRPMSDWGRGQVVLVEIPSGSEANDNIVAYWRPAKAVKPGAPFTFTYKLTFPNDHRASGKVSRVVRTGYGRRLHNERPEYAVDYEAEDLIDAESIELEASAEPASGVEAVVTRLPGERRFRVFLSFDPKRAAVVETRIVPRINGRVIGETWLTRWSKDS